MRAGCGVYGLRAGIERQVAHLVALAVAVLRRLDLHVGDEGDQMQLLAVLHLHAAGGVTDGRQRALRDLDGLGIGIHQVEPIE